MVQANIFPVLHILRFILGILLLRDSTQVICYFRLFMLPDLKEWYDNSKSFWLSLFQVTVLDYMCKFLTMFFKCSILWCCTRFNYMHIRVRFFKQRKKRHRKPPSNTYSRLTLWMDSWKVRRYVKRC